MSTLQTKGFSQVVGSIAAGMQGRIASSFLNFAVGSMLRAIAEAYAGVALWLQKLTLDVSKLTRLATSYGDDADSFIADFGIVSRFGAQAATGLVTFSRFTAAATPVYVPVGTMVQTQDGSQKFLVYGDATNLSFLASYGATGAYVMAPLTKTVVAPVMAIAGGSGGNVAAGAITLAGSPVTGVDTVTNPAAFVNGIDKESDDGLKSRFRLGVLALGGGTDYAIQSAVANLKAGMQSAIFEQVDKDGTPDLGMVSVFIDDGSGILSPTLLASANTSVNAVRAAGIRVGVYGPSILYATVVMGLGVAAGYSRPVVVGAVASALASYINALGLEATLYFTRLSAIAYGVDGVTNVSVVTLNGGTSDLVPGNGQTIKTLSTIVS